MLFKGSGGDIAKYPFRSAVEAQALGGCQLASYAAMSEALTLGQALWDLWGCRKKSDVASALSTSV